MQRTIHLDPEQYAIRGGAVMCLGVIDQNGPRDELGELPLEWLPSAYQLGRRAVLVSSTDLSPNAIRDGRSVPRYWLHWDLDGVGGNSDHNIKRVSGWRGTTNDQSCDAHGIVTITKIRALKNGRIAVTVRA